MIRISRKTRYALRALLEMACETEKKIFKLDELSRHQGISRKYLETIFTTLKKRGIIMSKVGKKGGFYLPRNLKSITILRLLETLEGKLDIVNCKDSWHTCKRINFCPANAIWNELNTTLKTILASKNLQNLSQLREVQHKCAHIPASSR